MLWFYITGLAILAGAEMNAEIEHASPHGKDPGEKVPGQKKLLGARAARAFASQKPKSSSAPAPPPHLAEARGATLPPAAPPTSRSGWFAGVPIFLLLRMFRRRRD